MKVLVTDGAGYIGSLTCVRLIEALARLRPRATLAQMCEDTWRWQQLHPHGYD